MKDPGDGLTPGTRLEDFEIERELGAGGFGVTYLALDVQLSRRVAVKEYLPRDWGTRRRDGTVGPRSETDAAQYAWGLERFLKEARSLARFDHPNVVRVHRVFEGGGTAYLVTEYVDGPGGRAWRLSDELQASGPLTEVRVRALLESLMAGLEPVHASGLVHRDIKPSNVMLRADGSPVLIDFGAARQAIGQQSRSLTSVLTPGYAPIEQYSEKGRQGPWTDVYALGAVAYELLSGRRPDDATQRVLEDALPPLSRVSAHPVGGGLSSAVMAALTVDDRSRPQSLGAWRTLLPRSGSEAAGAAVPAPSRSAPRADDAGGAGSSAAGGLRRLLDFRRGSSASSAGVGGGAPSGRAPSPASSPTGGGLFGSPAASESAAEAAAVGGSAERRSGFGAAWRAGRWWLCGAGAVAAAGLAVALVVPGRETARRAPADVPAASPSVGARPPGGVGARPSGGFGGEAVGAGSPARARTEPDEPAVPPAGDSSAASAEAALGLDRATRRRVQAGLAGSGVNPGGADGIFGDRTREALAAWQGSRGSPATGYLTRADLSALLAAELPPPPPAPSAPIPSRVDAARPLPDARRVGERFRDCAECPELVVVPAGSFTMGSPSSEEGRFESEGPQRRVTIPSPLAVGVYEVTRGEFGRFVSATGHATGGRCYSYEDDSWEWLDDRGWRDPGFAQTDDHPVVCVSWEDAQAYVRWLSRETGARYRLLSESEWEYVARGGTASSRYWGSSSSGQCVHANGADSSASLGRGVSCSDGSARTARGGSYTSNGFGLYDVLGNVWEWVEDCWHGDYAGAPSGGSAWTSGGDCGHRVLRGGSWRSNPRDLRSASRLWSTAGDGLVGIGFRVSRTLD